MDTILEKMFDKFLVVLLVEIFARTSCNDLANPLHLHKFLKRRLHHLIECAKMVGDIDGCLLTHIADPQRKNKVWKRDLFTRLNLLDKFIRGEVGKPLKTQHITGLEQEQISGCCNDSILKKSRYCLWSKPVDRERARRVQNRLAVLHEAFGIRAINRHLASSTFHR